MRFSRGHSISHPLPIEPASNQTPRSQSSGPGTHSMLAAVCRSRKDWPGAAHPDVAAFGTEAPPPTEITALGAPQLEKGMEKGGFGKAWTSPAQCWLRTPCPRPGHVSQRAPPPKRTSHTGRFSPARAALAKPQRTPSGHMVKARRSGVKERRKTCPLDISWGWSRSTPPQNKHGTWEGLLPAPCFLLAGMSFPLSRVEPWRAQGSGGGGRQESSFFESFRTDSSKTRPRAHKNLCGYLSYPKDPEITGGHPKIWGLLEMDQNEKSQKVRVP